MLVTLCWMMSQLGFLVCVHVALSCTPTMSRCSERIIYWHFLGKSSCCRVLLHLPRGRNLHFRLAGSLCSRHPDAASKSADALSTRLNSSIVTTAGFKSSAYDTTLYRSSKGGRTLVLEVSCVGPNTGILQMRIPVSLRSRKIIRGSMP